MFLNNIHSVMGVLPYTLREAINLRSLQLNDNQFEGFFPDFLEDIKELEVLNLVIGNLSKLRILVLKSNYFNGSIPKKITKLKNLQGYLLSYIIELMYLGFELEMVSKGSELLILK
ncbi:hypothetical protein AMTRI_Chr12g241820 [Amborella trichopoda]